VAQDYRNIAQLGLDMLFSRIHAQESGAAVETELRRLDSHLIMRGSA
jgi:DNA-binding LacI/PurR family transcriptional regulator